MNRKVYAIEDIIELEDRAEKAEAELAEKDGMQNKSLAIITRLSMKLGRAEDEIDELRGALNELINALGGDYDLDLDVSRWEEIKGLAINPLLSD